MSLDFLQTYFLRYAGEIPGGIVQSAKLLRQSKPVYPQLAKQARIQGIVNLHALETEIDVKFMLSRRR